MTREEAIFTIENRDGIMDYGETEQLAEALEIAIEALKAEPCEDTISRKHLLSEIDKLMQSPWFNNGKDDDMITHYGYVERKEAVEIVRDLCVKEEPPVTPKQRTGKWITQHVIGGRNCEMIVCSNCREEFSYDAETGIQIDNYDYCPNCGAKMEGE